VTPNEDPPPTADRFSSTYSLYGVSLRSDFPFKNRLHLSEESPHVTFKCSPGRREGEAPTAGENLLTAFPSAGAQGISFHVTDGGYMLRFAGSSTFTLLDDRIDCIVSRSDRAYLVEIQLLGMILATWLERRGTPTLHASAVEVEGGAVAFVGAKGAGKTSMAATFLQGGSALLTEDLLALVPGPEGVVCHAGYPQMRMWPEEARHFLSGTDGLEIVHPAFAKLRVLVGPAGLGSFCPDPRPLVCIYVLERREDGGGGIEIQPIVQREAVAELIRHSFVPELVQAMGLQARRLTALVRVVSSVPLWKLSYPGGLEHLPDVRSAVVRNLDRQRVT
jgi:hypothetical protein